MKKKRVWSVILVLTMILTLIPMGTFSAETPSGRLKFYWSKDDGNGNYVPDTSQLESYAHQMWPTAGSPVFFYYVDDSGNEIQLSLSDLQSSDPTMITLSDCFGSVMMNASSTATIGATVNINYVKDGVTVASMPVEIVQEPSDGPSILGPALAYRISDWSTNVPQENTMMPLYMSYGNNKGYGDSVFVYYLDVNNSETRLSASDLTSSDTNVVQISADTQNPNAVHLEFVGEGTAKINYTINNETYSIDVTVHAATQNPPQGGPMVFFSDTSSTTGTQLNTFTVTENDDTFYLVTDSGWKFTDVTLLDDFEKIADCEIDASGSFAVIKVNGVAEGWQYALNYTVENTSDATNTYSDMRAIQLVNQKPVLMYRFDASFNPQNVYTQAPGMKNAIYFYYIAADGTETPVTIADLTSSNQNVVRISKNTSNANAVDVETVNFGEGDIIYTDPVSGKTYTVKVDVTLPQYGLYSSSTASQNTYIREFTVTETNDTFYLVATDDWYFTDVRLLGDLDTIADVTIDSSKRFASIKVTGIPSDGRGYDLEFDAKNDTYNNTGTNLHLGIKLYNGKPALMFRYPGWNNGPIEDTNSPLSNFYGNAPGFHNSMFFYYVENGNAVRIAPNEIKSSNENIVKVSQSMDNSDAVFVEALGFGDTTLYYEKDGKKYELNVRMWLPNVGLYSTTIADESTYLMDSFTITDTNNKYYLVASNGYTLTGVSLQGNFGDIANVQLDSIGRFATIEVTGIPEDGCWYGINYTATDTFGNVYSELTGICLADGKTGQVCQHTNTQKVDAKTATCTTDGYTGDIVCKDCDTLVKKGEIVKASGHDVKLVNTKAATCTTDGYTGDKVCKVCETTVEKGEVAKATGHVNTKIVDKKATTCTTDGYTGDVLCTDCNKVVNQGEVAKTTGHKYVDNECQYCKDKLVVAEKVEVVDTSKPVEKVTPVVKQEAVETATKAVINVIEAIISNKVTEEVKTAVSEETIAKIKEAMDEGKQITTEVVANVVTEDTIQTEVVQEIKNAIGTEGTVAQYLDLSIMIQAVAENGEATNLGTLNELGEKLTFTIAIPTDLVKAGREFYVVRVHEGEVDKLSVTKNEDETYSFETDKFSTYALVYEDTATPVDTSPKTKDMYTVFITFSAILGLGILYVTGKKKRLKTK